MQLISFSVILFMPFLQDKHSINYSFLRHKAIFIELFPGTRQSEYGYHKNMHVLTTKKNQMHLLDSMERVIDSLCL